MFKTLLPFYAVSFCVAALMTSAGSLVATLLPFLGWTQETFGLALSWQSLGAVLGGIMIARFATLRNVPVFFVSSVVASVVGYACVFSLPALLGYASQVVALFGFLLAGVAGCGFLVSATTRIFDGGGGPRDFAILQIFFAGGLMSGPLLASLLSSSRVNGADVTPLHFPSVFVFMAIEIAAILYYISFVPRRESDRRRDLTGREQPAASQEGLVTHSAECSKASRSFKEKISHLTPMALASLGILSFLGVEVCLFGFGPMWAADVLGFSQAAGGLLSSAIGVGYLTSRIIAINVKAVALGNIPKILTFSIFMGLAVGMLIYLMAANGVRDETLYQSLFFLLGLVLGNDFTWTVVSMSGFYSGEDATRQSNKVSSHAFLGVTILPIITGQIVARFGMSAIPATMAAVLCLSGLSYGLLAAYGKRKCRQALVQ